ncbi:MAG TPA: hypothetical protein VLH77_06065, partial [Gammaproteobacteria bacterium]|nr:hypothetical protein [Gammaproteobacteria bacterium]
MTKTKLSNLSASLKKQIVTETLDRHKRTSGTLSDYVQKSKKPVTAMAEATLRHCNGGATLQAAYWLKNHL